MVGYKTRFIVNPIADKGRAGRLAEELRPMLDSFGEVEFCATTHPAHGTELARQAGEAGCRLVIAAGGDGTIHEVVNGLMQVPLEARPRLGIVPLGSGNDFAPMIGITGKPEETLQKVFTGEPRRIDVGKFVLGYGKPEYFNNTFGLGFDATVTIRTLQLKRLRGYLMYLVAVLQTIALNLDAPMMHIETESTSWDEETIMLVVCNGPREGEASWWLRRDATDGN
jgi:YegS/Rv2252/BmrU family lipid kinase